MTKIGLPNQGYFPANEADRVVWLTHFCTKLSVYGPDLGFSADDIANTQADVGFYVWVVRT